MAFLDPAWLVLLALLLDLMIGDPSWLYARVWHPVVAIGALIERGEAWLNHGVRRRRLWAGAVLTLALVALALGVGWGLQHFLRGLAYGWVIEVALASSLLAFRGLHRFIKPVERALRLGDLNKARKAVSQVVGRDPNRLDAAGVARAAIESLAENYSDGALAPLFWYALTGLPGLLAYKTINTLDSMIGHRNDRYEAFGKVAARLDDIVNWPPARLTALVFVVAAWLRLFRPPLAALRLIKRDASKHRSVNAGWPETAMAAALNIRLAGPRDYGDYQVNDPWIGDGPTQATAQDLGRAFTVFWTATGLLALACLTAGLWAQFSALDLMQTKLVLIFLL